MTIHRLSTVSFALLLTLFAGVSAAQTGDDGAAAEPEQSQTETSESEGEDAGEDAGGVAENAAPANEAPASEITITEHGDWELRCEANDNCFMYQLTRDEELNPVAEISIVSLPEGGDAAAGVTVVTPLATLLTEGVIMQVDSGRAVKYEFGWCTRAGCFARFGLTPAELNNMKRGNTAKLRIVAVSASDRPVILNVSLTGFTAAFNEMSGG